MAPRDRDAADIDCVVVRRNLRVDSAIALEVVLRHDDIDRLDIALGSAFLERQGRTELQAWVGTIRDLAAAG
jgi:hypothetical protein